jgi:hypothetical protein
MDSVSSDTVIAAVQMLDAGIVPVIITRDGLTLSRHVFENPEDQLHRAMALLAPEERRLAARKFRKLWRRLAKKFQGPGATRAERAMAEGLAPNSCPSASLRGKQPRSVRHERMHAVASEFLKGARGY